MNNKQSIISQSPIAGLFLFFIGIAVVSCNDDDTQTVSERNNLVWSDEFNVDGAPNPANWGYDIGNGSNTVAGFGWGNNEQQYYTDRPENAVVQNGFLVITAREESFEGSSYTSARLTTRNLFDQQYGRVEARMRVPFSPGLWPAFWLLGANCCFREGPICPDGDLDISTCPGQEEIGCVDPVGGINWPACGEIDIFEWNIAEPTASSMAATLHGPGYSAGESISVEYETEDLRFDEGFHVFGMDWNADRFQFYVDGTLYGEITRSEVMEQGDWVFDNPFYLIFNLAVGGFGQGNPNVEFPQTMLVDYVRVYN